MGESISTVGALAGLCGFLDPDWIKVLVDAEGHIQIDVLTTGLPSGAATESTLVALSAKVVAPPTAPTIYNVTMTTASTEYSQALPANTRKFMIKCRGEYDIQVCFVAEGSGTLYITVPSEQTYWEDQINDASITLYFQCATAAQVAEIVAWA